MNSAFFHGARAAGCIWRGSRVSIVGSFGLACNVLRPGMATEWRIIFMDAKEEKRREGKEGYIALTAFVPETESCV
jgi:hypothetical protein